jgi:hypothetical protein
MAEPTPATPGSGGNTGLAGVETELDSQSIADIGASAKAKLGAILAPSIKAFTALIRRNALLPIQYHRLGYNRLFWRQLPKIGKPCQSNQCQYHQYRYRFNDQFHSIAFLPKAQLPLNCPMPSYRLDLGI